MHDSEFALGMVRDFGRSPRHEHQSPARGEDRRVHHGRALRARCRCSRAGSAPPFPACCWERP
eukprot:6912211-Alexandrium_andersonii.AAC.1